MPTQVELAKSQVDQIVGKIVTDDLKKEICKVITYIGTNILILPLRGRNSTQKAPRDTLVYQIFCSFLRRF